MKAVSRLPQPGDLAPAIALLDEDGMERRLEELQGKWAVVYFYSRDDTPGCTVEACSFRDTQAELRTAGAEVWGVSPQDARSHRRFRDRHRLGFPLLVDADHAVAQAYGVWIEKGLYGRRYWGNARATFLIGPDGRIAWTWLKVKPEGHAAEVLATLHSQQAARPG